jgi:hypothetical protein
MTSIDRNGISVMAHGPSLVLLLTITLLGKAGHDSGALEEGAGFSKLFPLKRYSSVLSLPSTASPTAKCSAQQQGSNDEHDQAPEGFRHDFES